jgi:sugar transferase (PEP-CTERM system associated)
MVRLLGFYIHLPMLVLASLDAAVLGGTLSYLGVHTGLAWSSAASNAALLFASTVQLLAYAMGLYRPKYLAAGGVALVLRVLIALLAGGLLAGIALAALPGHGVTPAVTALATAAGFAGVLTLRWLVRPFLSKRTLRTRLLILGTGPRAAQMEKALEMIGPDRAVCVGYYPVSTGPAKVPQDKILRANDLQALCHRLAVDEVVVAAEPAAIDGIAGSLRACRRHGVEVVDISTFLERELGQVDAADSCAAWLLYSDGAQPLGIAPVAKRAMDVVLSLALLLLTLPVLALTALAIWLEDRGPIFYLQERVGLGGRTFKVVKFRSMRIDAEADGKARWASQGDPRVTRIGRFIRTVRIDEIPQIWNVLRNDMSFIGPRPERPSIVEDLMSEIPTFGYRHLVKPGITGWAQVNYPYGASKEDSYEKLKFDLYYIKNGGLILDLLIILQTLRVIIWPEGVR